MRSRKKIVYLFVFHGYADYETSMACAGICKSDEFKVVTIAMKKDAVVSSSGLTIVPDHDFIPQVDLADIDKSNTAMLILPGGIANNDGIAPLVDHCLSHGIPVATANGLSPGELAHEIFDTLNISEEARVSDWFHYFQHREVAA